MPEYLVTVEDVQRNSKWVEASSPQEARAIVEKWLDNDSDDESTHNDITDFLYEGDENIFIRFVSWFPDDVVSTDRSVEMCDDNPERLTRWWHDARIACRLAKALYYEHADIPPMGSYLDSLMGRFEQRFEDRA